VPGFAAYDLVHGPLAEHGDTAVAAWSDTAPSPPLTRPAAGTHYGYVFRGPTTLRCEVGEFTLATGMYFAVPDVAELRGGQGLLVTHRGHRGLRSLGGPLEPAGRLRYIDGCTDTLLLAPATRGDPCVSVLYFPPHTRQTAHTHPSVRVGVVASGSGACVLPGARVPLRPGLAFVIAAGALHSFATADDPLVVVAYHPDSDHGPTHADHPMINRTFIDGVSAAHRSDP
jgi:quercetin dioxygenase-like cupin family protein